MSIAVQLEDEVNDILDLDGKAPTKIQRIEWTMKKKYDFQFNSIKMQVEHREKGTTKWFPMSKIRVNDMRRFLDDCGHNTSTSQIKEILNSSFSEMTNPLQSYIKNLKPLKDKIDYIDQIAQCVTCDSEHFNYFFKKWFVALVANFMNDYGCQNQSCLVFAGEQGVYKSTFFANLLPSEWSSYIFIGKPKTTDDERAWSQLMSEYVLICMDDCLKSVLKKDNESLKSYITQGVIKFRRMYDEFYSEPARIGSFAATVNGNDVLTDLTGNRRFLCFGIKIVDIERLKSIDKDKALSQAYDYVKAKWHYWFDKADENLIQKINEDYTIVNIEEQFINEYCIQDTNGHMQNAAIAARLQEITRINYISSYKIGEVLKKQGYRRYQKTIAGNRVWGWNIQVNDTSNNRD